MKTMQPFTPMQYKGSDPMPENALIFDRFAGVPLLGAIMLPDGRVGIVMADGGMVAVERPVIVQAHTAETYCAEFHRRHRSEIASCATIVGLITATDDEPTPDVRTEARKMRDGVTVGTRRAPVKVIDEYAVPDFGEVIGTGLSDVENRARVERLAREIPEVPR
jgi:hypothetical protein